MKYKVGDRVRLSDAGIAQMAKDQDEISLGFGKVTSVCCIDIDDYDEYVRVRWDDGYDNLHKEHELAPATGFTAGEEYTDRNATKWRCIHIREDGNAVLDNGTDVIVNYADGSNMDGWDHLDFSFTKSATCGGTYCMPVTGECHKYRINFDIVNGKPDWQNAKVTGV